MRYSDLRKMILANWQISNKIIPYVESEPGIGKSALGRQLRLDMGVLDEHFFEFNLSNRSETDIIGLPNNSGECSKWVPPEEFWALRDIPGDDRPRFLLVEELSDGGIQMQNPMCRVFLDRCAGNLKLHHNLYIYASGNRVEHKSGANRIITKLAGRMQRLAMDFNLNDFSRFWIEKNLDLTILQALRHEEKWCLDFDPMRDQNPTPRTWEFASLVDPKLPLDLYLRGVEGYVGPGAAQYLVTFRAIMDKIDDPDLIVMNPDKFDPPKDAASQYATLGSLVPRTSPDNLDRLLVFVNKFRKDLRIMFMNDLVCKYGQPIKDTKAFVKFSVEHANLMF